MLHKLIDKVFVDRKEEVLSLLKDYRLDRFISSFYEKVLSLHKDDFTSDKKVLSSLSSSLLTRINSVLETIENEDEKDDLEFIFSEIANEFIFHIIQIDGIAKDEVLTEIRDSLAAACEANWWNKEALFRRTKIELMHALTAKASSPLTISKKQNSQNMICYYTWLKREGKSYSLDDFSYDLKGLKDVDGVNEDKLIKSVTEFKRLFSTHDGNIRVKMNGEQLEFIIILFDQLDENNFISVNGTKGHFHPLKKYCIDFEEKELIKTTPKRIKERIKRNPIKHKFLLDKVHKLLGLVEPIPSDLNATLLPKSQIEDSTPN